MQLTAYLAANGLTVPKFGLRVGVPNRQTMYQYARGFRFPPPEVLAKISEETGGEVTADDFVRQHMAARAAKPADAQASAA